MMTMFEAPSDMDYRAQFEPGEGCKACGAGPGEDHRHDCDTLAEDAVRAMVRRARARHRETVIFWTCAWAACLTFWSLIVWWLW